MKPSREDACPLVSIITPTRNSGRTLERTISSVVSQDYQNLEHLIIDGASTDDTVEIIKRHGGDIAYWVSEPDEGIADAFNKGIRACRGEIVGIINSDDRYADQAVSTAVSILRDHPDCDFVHGDVVIVDAEGRPLLTMKSHPAWAEQLRFTMSLAHPSVFVRKTTYDALGSFDTSYRVAMDYEFLVRIVSAGRKGVYADRPLAYVGSGGKSYANFFEGYKEVCRASIQYGYSPVMAYARLYAKALRGTVRAALEFMGFRSAVNSVRKLYEYCRVLRA